ncbi:MAG: DUF1015 domain-containing protein [Ruminococcaceae bacterium]|nr:DUF1015 domain-containing protein [Oscillospiraceae bacterium]
MAEIKTFKALRFTDKAGDIAKNVCPPYDIISDAQRVEYLNDSRYNIIRLELPKGDDPYAQAGETLEKWLQDGILKQDDKDGLYIYEEEFEAYGQKYTIRGMVCLVKLEEFSKGVVLPHEETLSKAKTDRFNLMSATYCNFSQIYSMYIDETNEISGKVNEIGNRKPDIEFKTADGVIQRLWVSQNDADNEFITSRFKDKQLYIADGHHRYETALNFKKKMIEDGTLTDETQGGNYVMMFLIDIDNPGLVIFPTHRFVRDLANYDEAKTVEGIKKYFDVEKINGIDKLDETLRKSDDKRTYAYYTGKDYYYLCRIKDESIVKQKLADKSEAYCSLDVTALHTLILEEVFGIDKENMAKQINLTYTRDFSEAIEKVKDGTFQCSFILNSTKIHQIKDVALAGEKMPQKSTYFYPKLITGLVMNKLK